jgi:2',3'-cyclic-nucleotide 2'-phosphodiesterase (5'-nucleotidase family)
LYKANNPSEHVKFTKQYTIVNKVGYKIALIGYIPDYSLDILHKRIAPYKIDDDIDNFTKIVKQINSIEQPDLTIVVAHDKPQRLANKLFKQDVQFLTGGHDHNGRAGIAKSGIPYIQADAFANGYSTATITIKPNKEFICDEKDIEYIPITDDDEKIKLLYDNPENLNNLDKDILNLSHIS